MNEFFSRRIPNMAHGLSGYQDSLISFYLSVCDVSRYFLLLFKWNILKKSRTQVFHHGCGHVK
jgi:hypothetical protein